MDWTYKESQSDPDFKYLIIQHFQANGRVSAEYRSVIGDRKLWIGLKVSITLNNCSFSWMSIYDTYDPVSVCYKQMNKHLIFDRNSFLNHRNNFFISSSLIISATLFCLPLVPVIAPNNKLLSHPTFYFGVIDPQSKT